MPRDMNMYDEFGLIDKMADTADRLQVLWGQGSILGSTWRDFSEVVDEIAPHDAPPAEQVRAVSTLVAVIRTWGDLELEAGRDPADSLQRVAAVARAYAAGEEA